MVLSLLWYKKYKKLCLKIVCKISILSTKSSMFQSILHLRIIFMSLNVVYLQYYIYNETYIQIE